MNLYFLIIIYGDYDIQLVTNGIFLLPGKFCVAVGNNSGMKYPKKREYGSTSDMRESAFPDTVGVQNNRENK